MTEQDRLQGVVQVQAKEIRRLRKMLEVVRAAQVQLEFSNEGGTVNIVATAIGIDEYLFIDKMKAALTEFIQEVGRVRLEQTGEITDESGSPMDAGVSLPTELQAQNEPGAAE